MEGWLPEEVEQKEVAITGGSCAVPVIYREVFAVAGIFLAPTLKLRDLLPTSKLVPAEVMPGKGLLAVVAFDYRDTSIGPYREVGIAVPARYRPRFNPMLVPPLRMAASLSYEAFVWQLPVTTETALHAGIDIWGYPKFLAEIEFEESEEGGSGLGVLSGRVLRLRARRVPHMGWNTLSVRDGSALLLGLDGADVYFAHSYACAPADAALVAAETDHEGPVVAAVESGALAGVQFHPERSGAAGARLLANLRPWSRSA